MHRERLIRIRNSPKCFPIQACTGRVEYDLKPLGESATIPCLPGFTTANGQPPYAYPSPQKGSCSLSGI